MTENPLRNRRRGQSLCSQQPPELFPQKLDEEEVVWGKTPGGEGRSEIAITIVKVID